MPQRPPSPGSDRWIHPLSVVRAERGWTYQQVVDIVARRIGNAATRREKAWRWEHWHVVPDLDSQLALAAELGIAESRVRAEPWPAWLPTGETVTTAFGWTQTGSLDALDDALERAMVDRRGFMTLTGAALTEVAGSWLTAEPAALVAVLRGGRTSATFVEQMEAGLPRLRLLETTHGGARARRLIDAELAMVVEVLNRSSYTTTVARRLYRLAAELGRMAGWASFDAGLHTAAQRYWIAALHAAHAGNDRYLAANILKSMSLQCYDFGQPREALALATSATVGVRPHRAGGNRWPKATAMLALREARAYAALNDAAACERLISQAERDFDRTSDNGDDPGWLSYFDAAEFHGQVGTCYLDLHRPATAEEHLDQALRLDSTKTRDRATYLIRRACAQTQLGQADQAVALLATAVPLIQQAPSHRNLRRAQRAREHLPLPGGDPRVQKLDQAMAALVA